VPRAEGSRLSTALLEPGGTDGRAPRGCGLATVAASAAFAAGQLQAPDDAVAKSLLDDAERLLPGLGGSVRFVRLARSEAALPRFEVGAYRRLERLRRVGGELRARGRRLYLAGDYLAGPRLEDSIASAVRAAREVLEDLGRAPSAPRAGARRGEIRER
jgi:protoporphyrinogen oxidase